MSFTFSTAQFDTQRNIQRSAAIALLALIHVLAIGALLTSRQASPAFPRSVREIIISFPGVHPRAVPQTRAPARTHGRARSVSPSTFTLAPGTIPPATSPDLSGVGHVLFGCDPASMMSPDQQAGCGALAAKPLPEEIGMPKTSHVVQTARWMHELAIKHSRRLVPCVGFFGPIFAVDLVCVAEGLKNGFGELK